MPAIPQAESPSHGLSRIDVLLPSPKSGYFFEYDYANEKLKAMHPRAAIADSLAIADHAATVHTVTDTLVIDTGATSVTSTAANGDIIGGSIAVADHPAEAHSISGVAGVAAGPGEEVPNLTDLSGVTGVRILVIGV
jgi:hypothetical protein